MQKEAFIDVQKTFDIILNDVKNNLRDVFNESEYYTRKYRGDIINDINLGVYLNDNRTPTVQIYVSNKFQTIRHIIEVSKDFREIISENHYSQKHTQEKKRIKVLEFDHELYNEEYTLQEALEDKKLEVLNHILNRSKDAIDNAVYTVQNYPVDGIIKIEMFIDE